MAKGLTVARPMIVQLPRPRSSGLRRFARRHIRTRGRGKASPFSTNKMLAVSVGGAAVGYAGGQGWLKFLPKIGGSRMFTLGLAGWAATRFFRSSWIKSAGLAALSASAFHWGLSQTTAKTIEGDDPLEGDDVVLGEGDWY